MRLWLALLLAVVLIPSPAAAEPITTTMIVTALVTAVIGAAVSIAITLALTLLFPVKMDTAKQKGLRTRKFDPHPPFRFAFGEFPQGGSVIFQAANDDEYFAVYLLNSLPSETITKIQINDGTNLVLLSGDGENDVFDMTKGAQAATPPWDDGIFQMWIGLGEHTTIPVEFTTQLGPGGGEIADLLQSTDLWSGVTVAFIQLTYGKAKDAQSRWGHGRPPPLLFHGQWSKLYDPRLDSTSGVTGASGSHRIDDKTTWAYSANPSLCGLMLAQHDFALGFDKEMIPIQQWADAADVCDVEDGAIAETELHDEDWSGSDPVAFLNSGDQGSGVWAVSAGSAPIGTAIIAELNGAQIVQLTSTDTDGTLVESEFGRFGIYFKMEALARRGDAPYEFRYLGDIGGWVGESNWRWRIYTADDIGGALDDGLSRIIALLGLDNPVDSTPSGREASMMPSSAVNITEIFDTGAQEFPGPEADRTHEVTGDLVSFVFEGGRINEQFIEIGPLTFFTTSLSAKTRYRCDGIIAIEDRELSLLDPVLASMGGHLDTTGGMLGVRAGVWVAPTDTLSQPVGDEIEISGARDAGFDLVRSKFIGRHREWQETDGPGYALRAGNRIYPLHLEMVREPEQAARLEKIFGGRAEPNRSITATWDGREAGRRIGERVNFALPGFARASSTYIIHSIQQITQEVNDGFQTSVQMTIVEDLESTYDWVSGDFIDPGAFTPAPPSIVTISPPSSVTAAQANFQSSENVGGAMARLKITVVIDQQLSADAETLRVEVSDGSGFMQLVDMAVTLSTLTYITYLNRVSIGVTYTARARAEATALGDSTWVTSAAVTIVTPALDYDATDYNPEYA